MTTDAGLHLLGTKPVHLVPPFILLLSGVLIESEMVLAFAVGMLVVLTFGNTRTVATYRWRVDEAAETVDRD